jgi:Bacterial Ig domain
MKELAWYAPLRVPSVIALFGACIALPTLSMLCGTPSSFADTAMPPPQLEFSAANNYSPDVLFDTRINNYVIYYGGEATSAQIPHDAIYYRTASNVSNGVPDAWNSSQKVVDKGDIKGAWSVSDPSVTLSTNPSTGQLQYTMFFTACMNSSGCGENEGSNAIYTATSTDGTHWTNYQPLLENSYGPAGPSALYVQIYGVWLVYFVERVEYSEVQVVLVNDNLDVIPNSQQTVLSTPDMVISDPFVAPDPQGNFHLWFQEFPGGNLIDTYESVSTSATSFSTVVPVLTNSGNPYCVTGTPSAEFVGTDEYELFFGLQDPNSQGNCTVPDSLSVYEEAFGYSDAPTTSVSDPSNNATVSGSSVILDAAASSPVGVESVDFTLTGGAYNDTEIATATSTYYGWIASWDSTTVADGSYQLQSVATGEDGETATSSPITITVDN